MIEVIISLLLTKLWLFIIVMIIGGAETFCYLKFVMLLKYSFHIPMCVQSIIVTFFLLIDNGAKDVEASLAMMEMMKEQWGERIGATLHFYVHREKPVSEFLKKASSFEKIKDKAVIKDIILGFVNMMVVCIKIGGLI